MNRLLAVPVLAAGIYLVVLGIVSIIRPDHAKRFLAGHASSARAHFTELVLRLIVGGSLVVSGPQMKFPALFLAFGWVLVGTTVLLLAVPWRVHHRFAAWSVPMATRSMALFAVGALGGGAFVLLSLLLPRVGV
jgi:hypothetical protein